LPPLSSPQGDKPWRKFHVPETVQLTKQQESSGRLSALPHPGDSLFINPKLVEDGISGLNDLPPKLRAAKFRELAFQAKCSAANAEGSHRQAFIDSAGMWQRLANLAEQEAEIITLFGS
jgi:hypothetical protein